MLESFIKAHGKCYGGHQWFYRTICCGEYANRAKHSPSQGPWFCSGTDCGEGIDVTDPEQAEVVCATCGEVVDRDLLEEIECDTHECPVCTFNGKVYVPTPASNWEIHLLDPNDPPAEKETQCTECEQRFKMVAAV